MAGLFSRDLNSGALALCDFLLETNRLFIYLFQESVKMGIPVLKIATTFIMKCMNVTVTMDSCSVTMVTVA